MTNRRKGQRRMQKARYRERYPEKVKMWKNRYYEKHKEEVLAANEAYRQAHKDTDQWKARIKAWRKAQRPGYFAEMVRNWRAKKRERIV